MSQLCENNRAYVDALNKLRFSEEAKSRMTQALLDQRQPVKRRTRWPMRTVLIAAAICVVLTITALAAVPTIWNAIRATQGTFAPYAQTIEGAIAADQGIEIQVLSALSDDVRGWVYFSVRDVEEDRLDDQLVLSGKLDITTTVNGIPKDSYASANLWNAKLISYDPNTKTALYVLNIWFGKHEIPTEQVRFAAKGMTTQGGYLQGDAYCDSVTEATLEDRPATEKDEVLLSPSDVIGASYDDSVLPEKQVVLLPGQNPTPIEGTEDMWVSSIGFASDGCFHVRLEFAEGVQADETGIWGIASYLYDDKHGTFLVRLVEDGQDIVFPLVHPEDADQLSQVHLYGRYTRPGVELTGDWSIDFEMAHYTSMVLDWTGEFNELQVTQITVSPLSVTLSSTGKGTFATAELSAVLKDGSEISAEPSKGIHSNVGADAGVEDWVNYNTWEFTEPVDVESIVSLTLQGKSIPVESGE